MEKNRVQRKKVDEKNLKDKIKKKFEKLFFKKKLGKKIFIQNKEKLEIKKIYIQNQEKPGWKKIYKKKIDLPHPSRNMGGPRLLAACLRRRAPPLPRAARPATAAPSQARWIREDRGRERKKEEKGEREEEREG